MNETWLIYLSVLLQAAAVAVQVTAAYHALNLIRVIGKSPAWLLISAGFCIMAIRRSISLAMVLKGDIVVGPGSLWNRLLAGGATFYFNIPGREKK